MRILYHHRIASKDGQYVHIEELTSALKMRGHELVIIGPGKIDDDTFGSDGGIVAKLKRYIPSALYELMEFGYSIFALIRLIRAIRRYKPDCIYERYNLYLLSGVWAGRIFNLPVLLEVNAPLFSERVKFSGIFLPALARWTETYAWRSADAVLPVTRVLANIIEHAGVDSNKIVVIPNGINPRRFSGPAKDAGLRKRLGLENSLVLGFSGFVREWHRLERVVDLLETGEGQRPRHLLLVGDGPSRAVIESRAMELGVHDKVTITGIVPREKISEYVSCFDIALQPDVVEYASPLKLFEYLALGRPVVAPDTPNIREVLENGSNALLFDPEDDSSFLHAVERLCNEPDLRENIGIQASRTIAEGGFTWDNNARRVEEIFERLVSGKSPG